MTDHKRALAFVARYRDCFPDVLNKWPTDKPLPDFPGLIARLGLAKALEDEFAAVRAEAFEQAAREAATWKSASPHYKGPERQAYEDGGERTARIIAERIRALAASASRPAEEPRA